jgi:hypothetical protein
MSREPREFARGRVSGHTKTRQPDEKVLARVTKTSGEDHARSHFVMAWWVWQVLGVANRDSR